MEKEEDDIEENDIEGNDIEEGDFEEETNFSSRKIPFNIKRENVNNFVKQSDEILYFTNFH